MHPAAEACCRARGMQRAQLSPRQRPHGETARRAHLAVLRGAVPRLRRRRSVLPRVARMRAGSIRCRFRPSRRCRCSFACWLRRRIGLLADRIGNYRLVIVALAWSALALVIGLSLVGGYLPILVIGVAFLLANGTMLPLIETIAVGGVRTQGLDYGRMRLWGSITFIIANFVGGVVIEALGGSFALWMIGCAAVADHRRGARPAAPAGDDAGGGGATRVAGARHRRRGCCNRGCSSYFSSPSAARTGRTRRSTRSARCTGRRRGCRPRGSARCGRSASSPRWCCSRCRRPWCAASARRN